MRENHLNITSQIRQENQKREASHNERETHSRKASQDREENQIAGASLNL
jgi:hypothetical protein